MTILLNESTPSTANPLASSSIEFKGTQKTTGDSSVFGDLMSGLWQTPQPDNATPNQEVDLALKNDGQTLAELGPIVVNTVAWTDPLALKAIHLGPHLNVITGESAPPDSESLEAFARAQGLDDQAVQWLFGTPTAAATPPSNVVMGSIGTDHPFQLKPETLLNNATDSVAPEAMHPLTNPTSAGPMENPVAAENEPVMASVLAAANALWRMTDDQGKAKVPVAAPHPINGTEDGVVINLLRMPPPATVWVQRNALIQLPENHSQKIAEPSVSELDMGADWVAEMMDHLQAGEGSAPNGASTTGTHGTSYANFAARWDALANLKADLGTATPTAPSESAARSENIQNLADKMGYAIGQRILSEMEKGQWHLKLQLRPATLGHIEIEMKMRSGEFDAIFTSPNSLTRDLLQDGMAKLKDTLSQMGMDVASIHVQDGQTGQRGGDSTPGTFGQKAQEEETSKGVAAETPLVQQVKKISDGLDILV